MDSCSTNLVLQNGIKTKIFRKGIMFGKSPWFQVGITKSILMVGWWLKEIIPWRQNLKDKCCILGKEEKMQASKFVIFIGSVYRLLLWHLLPNKSFLLWSKAWVVKKQKSLSKKRAKTCNISLLACHCDINVGQIYSFYLCYR